MRTTLTLDEDVARRIEGLRKERELSLRAVINEALRAGLPELEKQKRARKPHTTKAVSLGGCLVGCLDDAAEAFIATAACSPS